METDIKTKRFYDFTPDFRDPYERDRDRIIHSAAFRRLEYKTQVFINTHGDNFRTRLTHSLEVSQIARTVAKRLGLNEALAEAIALAHDLGHTPFGHIGGDALDDALKKSGSSNGFEHNYQSFRVLTLLENRYENFSGLNLTYATLEGVLKHSKPYYKPFFSDFVKQNFELDKNPSPEAMIVDYADMIAYLSADIEDAISNNIITVEKLAQNEFCAFILESIAKSNLMGETLKYKISTQIITILVNDLMQNSKVLLGRNENISFSEAIDIQTKELKHFLLHNVYYHESILIKMSFGERVVHSLFEAFANKPQMLPFVEREKFKLRNQKRVIADYIASLSDRAAQELYRKLF